MACPYFFPVEPDPHRSPPAHIPLPLGDAWTGLCHAAPGRPQQPDADALSVCNLGYARGRCPRFPAGDGPDAVRFSIRPGEGPSLHLYYVVERDHLPFAHGALEYRPTQGDFLPPGPEGPSDDAPQGAPAAVVRLARAYVSSYFRRLDEASPR
jgi:hypothetical protein